MSKASKRSFIPAFLFLVGFSCVQNFDFSDVLASDEEVIVNGVLVEDSIPVIYIHRSSNARAEGAFEPVDDASVKLYYKPRGTADHEYIEEELFFRDSSYVSDLHLLSDYEYLLEVHMADGNIMEASTYIPKPIRISSTRIIFPAGMVETPTFSGPFSRIEVNIATDASGQKSYFEIFNYNRDTIHHPNHDWEYTFFKTWNNDELILREAPLNSESFAFLFQFGAGDGTNISLSFDFIEMGVNPFSGEFYPVLNTVSEDYFLYKQSLYNHLESLSFREGFEFSDLYIPSIFKILQPVHSNIRGGRGIFAGLSSHEMKTTCNVVGYTCE